MEQIIDNPTPTGKIYKDRAIWAGTFLGGPLVAGYLIAENFKVFGDTDKVKKTWIFAIVATVVIFGGIFLVPDIDKIPKHIIPIIYTAIAYVLVQHYQGAKINSHISAGGQLFNWWRAAGIGLVGAIITFLSILGIAYLSDSVANASVTTKTYGIMKHEIDFDKSNISEKEVDNLADGFVKTTFFAQAVAKKVYAKKIGNNYELSFACDKSVTSSSDALEPFLQLRNDMQTLFPDHKIIFNFVVDNLDNVVKRLE